MKDGSARPWPPGYGVLRILSEEVGGVVALAGTPSGGLAALKLLRLPAAADPDQALARHRRLQRLTSTPGLLRMTACGLTADRAWIWEELVPAGGLDGVPPSAGDEYQPATLRAELMQRGRFPTEAVVEMGLGLCHALSTLHEAGLVHRDVKTGNLLRVEGQVVLGDYGLTAEPGTPFEFKGTEGYMPTEGAADYAADLFALGKTLYELWTGCDRLEFPTLPKPVLEGADWLDRGALLNAVLLQACSPQVRDRFRTAAQMAEALRGVAAGRKAWMPRRAWMTMGAAAVVSFGVLGFSLLSPRRAPVLVWRQRHAWNYIPTPWGFRSGSVMMDPVRNCVYHLNGQRRDGVQLLLGRLDLSTFRYDKRTVDWANRDPDQYGSFTVLRHPREDTLWLAEQGLGPVWRLDPDSLQLARLPGGEVGEAVQDRSHQNTPYWNPVTGRLGVFGGYGWFAVRNWRWEFDSSSGQWRNVEANRPGVHPRPRSHAQLMPMGHAGRSLLLCGGVGSLSGGQDDREPGLPHFDGRFHRLGDLWRLDLETGAWTALVGAAGLANPPSGRWSCCYLAQEQAVLVCHARAETEPFGTPVRMWMHQVGDDDRFQPLEQKGDVPDGAASGDLTALPGGRSALVFQKAGVFEVSLER